MGEHPQGVTHVVWNILGEGWQMVCQCGFTTVPCPALAEAAEEMEDHWDGLRVGQ